MSRIFRYFASFVSVLVMCAPLAVSAVTGPYPPPDTEPQPVGEAVPFVPDAEEVTAFAASIAVAADGMVTVTERINYFFPEGRHGIYRDIPTRYRMDDGRLLNVPIRVISVQNTRGDAMPYKTWRNRFGLRLKIGDPDVTLHGGHTYVIAYEAEGALRYFVDYDELNWDVTGDAWEVPIRRVSATVTLPDAVPPASVTIACYTGAEGSLASDCLKSGQGSGAAFAADGPMTVVVSWPPGLVAKLEAKPVSWLERAAPFLVFLLPLAVLAFMMRKWRRDGRDPKGRGTLMVEYEPPDNLTPAETGVLLDQHAGNNDVSAIIVDLAVRGWIVIREIEEKKLLLTSKDYEFERVRADEDGLKPFEKRMLAALFGEGKTVRVSDIKSKQVFYKERSEIASRLYEEMVLNGYYSKNPNKVMSAYVGVGVLVVFVGSMLGARMADAFGPMIGIPALIAMVLCGVIPAAFGPFMRRATQKGAFARERVQGFREYLKTAEKYRLQWQEKEGVFERFLPYAMAYGVADKWAGTFASMHLPPPAWYHGSALHAGVFNPVLFASAMNDMSTSANAAMTSQPSSSGGGGSGGGFGGGGGGSW